MRDRLRVWRRRLKGLKPEDLKGVCLNVWLYLGLNVGHMRRGNRSVGTSNQIHLINPLRGYTGGGPQRTLHLFEELKDHAEVCLWSGHEMSPEIAERYPVKQIAPWRFEFPKTGTLVFVGLGNLSLGPWVRYTWPNRIIVVLNNNSTSPEKFRQRLWHISNGGRREVEAAYASELTKRSAGDYPGFVQPSLIDIDTFVPSPSGPSDPAAAGGAGDAFTVGRLSRAEPYKHHPDDPELYRRLVENGCRIRIMGPSPSLKTQLDGSESVELLPPLAQEAHLFLQGLDCFFYRTSEEIVEASGRVVTEAMACGLPVVCHESGGYAEIIEHGRNGFLFGTQQEALEILLRLKEDRALRESVGAEARRTAEGLFSSAVRSEIVEFYLRT